MAAQILRTVPAKNRAVPWELISLNFSSRDQDLRDSLRRAAMARYSGSLSSGKSTVCNVQASPCNKYWNPLLTISALIVAAGRGQRMARDMPKQYLPLRGRAVLAHTIDALLASPLISHVRTVIHPDDQDLYETALQGTTDDRILPPVPGGDSRSASVALGLQSLSAQAPDHVLIHDAARPFCPVDLIERVLAPLDRCDGAFAALPVVDAMWKAVDGYATIPVDRTGLWRAQTPQAFRYDAILKAHQQLPNPVADDVEVARQAGLNVQIVGGDERNFKITLPADLDRAKRVIDGDF